MQLSERFTELWGSQIHDSFLVSSPYVFLRSQSLQAHVRLLVFLFFNRNVVWGCSLLTCCLWIQLGPLKDFVWTPTPTFQLRPCFFSLSRLSVFQSATSFQVLLAPAANKRLPRVWAFFWTNAQFLWLLHTVRFRFCILPLCSVCLTSLFGTLGLWIWSANHRCLLPFAFWFPRIINRNASCIQPTWTRLFGECCLDHC